MVRMEMIGGKRDKKGGAFYAVKSTVRLGVYEASSGRQIADTVAEGKELSAGRKLLSLSNRVCDLPSA